MRDPLVVWRGTLIDGHNRYEICTRHSIPFSVKEMNFYCREEAIAWICANQLGRRNLSEETRKYLIGKQYDSEKFVSKIKNPNGFNQYSSPESTTAFKKPVRTIRVIELRIELQMIIAFRLER